jgi:hypothetical protein
LFSMLNVVIIVDLNPDRPSRAMTEMDVCASRQRKDNRLRKERIAQMPGRLSKRVIEV